MSNEFLWVEKYRPKKINDTILPQQLKDTFNAIVNKGDLPNMLFTGTAGLGKTTVARALCNSLELDHIVINGSEEGNIETLRGKIKQFASTVSLQGGYKVVILDEADYLNPQSTQPALRGFIEEFSNNCRFILTCNFKNRIIEPLHSRCSVIEFKIGGKDKPEIASQFMKRVENILATENIEFDKKVVAELIMKHFPDWRRVLNELQRYSASGVIDTGILVNMSEDNYKKLVDFLKARNWKEMRKWVGTNSDVEPTVLYRKLYDTASEFIVDRSVPQLVLHIANYSYKSAFVADQEVNLVACLTEIMSDCEFD